MGFYILDFDLAFEIYCRHCYSAWLRHQLHTSTPTPPTSLGNNYQKDNSKCSVKDSPSAISFSVNSLCRLPFHHWPSMIHLETVHRPIKLKHGRLQTVHEVMKAHFLSSHQSTQAPDFSWKVQVGSGEKKTSSQQLFQRQCPRIMFRKELLTDSAWLRQMPHLERSLVSYMPLTNSPALKRERK